MDMSSNHRNSIANRAEKFGNPYDSVIFDDNSQFNSKKKGCLYFFKELDNKIMRPVFIYKYHQLVEKQPYYTFGDMLDEYKKIQEELAEAEDNIDMEIFEGNNPEHQSHNHTYDHAGGDTTDDNRSVKSNPTHNIKNSRGY